MSYFMLVYVGGDIYPTGLNGFLVVGILLWDRIDGYA